MEGRKAAHLRLSWCPGPALPTCWGKNKFSSQVLEDLAEQELYVKEDKQRTSKSGGAEYFAA